MMAQRWMAVTEPQFPWECSALTYLRERLPDQMGGALRSFRRASDGPILEGSVRRLKIG